jgi:hypothetical protein
VKTNAIYIFILIIAIGAVLLVFTATREKKFDDRVTLLKRDKIPYGTFVAYKELSELFPSARIYTSRYEPGYWDSVYVDEKQQAFISITDYFNADEFEMGKLLTFAGKGNYVFISAFDISTEAAKRITEGAYNSNLVFTTNSKNYSRDSMELLLNIPARSIFRYPGKNLSGYFNFINTVTTDVLGTDREGNPNFIHLRIGEGHFFLHLAPLAFSNYFLLHKNNIRYYETALSVIPSSTEKIVWDEYYLKKRRDEFPRENKKSWLNVLFRYPGFRAALIVAILTLIIYVLAEMRRKQRYIPVITKPRNDSLDFVRTIGRLYYEKGDHRNICRKMSAFFLEYVRSNYKLPTGTLDEPFIRALQYKSGYDEKQLREIVTFIKYAEDAPSIGSKDLNRFYRMLEQFYAKA